MTILCGAYFYLTILSNRNIYIKIIEVIDYVNMSR